MSDFLDDQLRGLNTAALPVLAAPSLVRARGEQRKRRTRVVTLSLATLLLAGPALALASTNGHRDSLSPAQEPSASASPEPSATPADQVSDAALLTADDAAFGRTGTWSATQAPDRTPLDPCRPTAYPQDRVRLDTSYRALTGPDGQQLVEQIALYATETDATEALAGFERAVKGCGQKPLEQGTPQPFQRIHKVVPEPQGPSTGDAAFFVNAGTACDVEQTCAIDRVRYAVIRVGPAVIVLEVDDPRARGSDDAHIVAFEEQVARTAHAAVQRVRCGQDDDCTDRGYIPSRFPRIAHVTHGATTWIVFLATSKDAKDPELARAAAAARAVGYADFASPLLFTCTQPGVEVLGYQAGEDVYAAFLDFSNPEDAQQFVDAFEPEIVKVVKVVTYCLD